MVNETRNVDATTSLFAVGDVYVDRSDPDTAYPAGDAFLAQGDIVFGNCEGVYGSGLEPAVTTGPPVIASPANAAALGRAGFHVVSLANNHAVDGGPAGVMSTIDALAQQGIGVVGAGPDIRAAHSPLTIERNGIRVAFLAYASVFPHGYEASLTRPGIAVVRSHTAYLPPADYLWLPGADPVIRTVEDPEDLAAFQADIAAARADADIVAVSMHWGDMYRPYVVMDHERRLGRAAIDAGADVVLGHHHHMLRGMEFHRGKPIWYGLGHHLFDLPDIAERIRQVGGTLPEVDADADAALDRARDPYALGLRPGYPHLPFHPDGRLTGVAVMVLGAGGALEVGFAPAVIGPDNNPRMVDPSSAEGKSVLNYFEDACREASLHVNVGPRDAASRLPVGSVRLTA